MSHTHRQTDAVVISISDVPTVKCTMYVAAIFLQSLNTISMPKVLV